MPRVGFSGWARSGKDYAAQRLMTKFGGHVMRFSDPLYELMYMVQEFVGFDKCKDRRLLQWLGTDWARRQDPNVWVRLLASRLDVTDPDESIYVTDMRFPGEADLLRSRGFTLVRIERANLPEADAPWRDHPSEHALDDYDGWDHVMTNCPDGPEFLKQVDALFEIFSTAYKITPP
jgi:hypothetical protein